MSRNIVQNMMLLFLPLFDSYSSQKRDYFSDKVAQFDSVYAAVESSDLETARAGVEKQREDLLSNFERKMLEHPEVLQCYFLSGDTDYFLIIHVEDMKSYHHFARTVFANEPNIKSFRTSFCMDRIKYSTAIAISEN